MKTTTLFSDRRVGNRLAVAIWRRSLPPSPPDRLRRWAIGIIVFHALFYFSYLIFA
ncbi:MAG: hypothetical protein QM627_04835 [Luteolibacter sp.]